ncbi:MAG TPA: sulfatase [Polyangiaceae bacterium]|nr:sulfatase [Polyangiaceae bacterium]
MHPEQQSGEATEQANPASADKGSSGVASNDSVVAPNPSAHDSGDPDLLAQWAVRGRACVIHSVTFGLFLLALRVDRIVMQGLTLAPIVWFQVLSAELSLLLITEATWLLTIRLAPHRPRLWAAAYILFHAPIYVLMISCQRFYWESGVVPKWEMLRYAASEFSNLKELLLVGVDRQLLILALSAAACLGAFPLTLARLRKPRWGFQIAIPGAMTVVGAILVMIPDPHDAPLSRFWGNWITDLLPDTVVEQYMNRPVEISTMYDPPVLDPTMRNPAVPTNDHPNFLIIALESTRTDLFSSYTGKASLTPFFDELVAKSVVIDNAYTTTSHTTKALVGILCGMKAIPLMRASETERGGLPLKCLPHLLHDAGYQSGFFQAAGPFEGRPGLIVNMGFDHGFVPTPTQAKGFAPLGYLGWEERVMMQPALNWQTRVKRPFLATVLTVSTHHPYESVTGGHPKSQSETRNYYERAARYVDDQFRMLFDQLEKKGVLDNTIVFVMGDHGEAFGERPGFFQHDSVPYDEVARVPMFIYAPKLLRPEHITGLRQQTDILPTILELAHLPWKGVLPGKSLLSTPGHERIITSCWYPASCLAMREGDTSFVFHFGHIPLEVFDLKTDPGQLHNIAADVPQATQERAIDYMLSDVASVQTYYNTAISARPRP